MLAHAQFSTSSRLTSKNSAPSAVSLVACRLWGIPGGKYHKSPGPYAVNVKTRRVADRHTNTNHVPGEIFPVLVYGCHLNMPAQYVGPLQTARSGTLSWGQHVDKVHLRSLVPMELTTGETLQYPWADVRTTYPTVWLPPQDAY